MSVLVDSSVWIDFFRGKGTSKPLEFLIEENLIATNDLILTELIPPLLYRKQSHLVTLLKELEKHPISPNWNDVRLMQLTCLRNGINGVGIPDLLIAQNAIQHHTPIFSRDKHFQLMSEILPVSLYEI